MATGAMAIPAAIAVISTALNRSALAIGMA